MRKPGDRGAPEPATKVRRRTPRPLAPACNIAAFHSITRLAIPHTSDLVRTWIAHSDTTPRF